MKKTFYFKKGNITDWDEPMMSFLEEYLVSEETSKNNYPIFRKNWKVTITIEELPSWKTKSVRQ